MRDDDQSGFCYILIFNTRYASISILGLIITFTVTHFCLRIILMRTVILPFVAVAVVVRVVDNDDDCDNERKVDD